MSIVRSPELQAFIERELLNQQSPAAVAGRLATGLDGLPYVSRETIERFIRSVYGRKLEYQLKVLRLTHRPKGRKKRPLVEAFGTRTFIDERPAVITDRERVGDLEADYPVRREAATC